MEPKYRPEQWVVFAIRSSKYMGQIIGAHNSDDDKGWKYTITNAAGTGNFSVPETDIIQQFYGNGWHSA